MSERQWNPEQKKAIESLDGNLLVSAAAGSGKTAVLVERVIRVITDETHPVDADRLLIVTFTKAAADEMKTRISDALAEKLAKDPENGWLRHQQLLMDRAHISTIHSFYTDVVTENFSRVGIFPDSKVADEQEAEFLLRDTLSDLLETEFEKNTAVFRELVEIFRSGNSLAGLSDELVKIYHTVRSLPHFEDWLDEKAALYGDPSPFSHTFWAESVLKRVPIRLQSVLMKVAPVLSFAEEQGLTAYADLVRTDVTNLEDLCHKIETEPFEETRTLLADYHFPSLPRGVKVEDALKKEFQKRRDTYKKPLQSLAKELSLYSGDSYDADRKALYPLVTLLFDLVKRLDRAFFAKKQEKHLIDYGDMEQLTLKALLEKNEHGVYVPTSTAKEIAARFDYVLADECQDNNKVQDVIFAAISRGNNLFFVGDVKQSIYRFRQAMPDLFLEKRNQWPLFDGAHYPATVLLGRNYRSRRNVADGVNFVFRQLMQRSVAEMDYTADEELIPEATFPESDEVRNEFLLIESPAGENTYETEARVIAAKVKKMVDNGVPVTENGVLRPCRYSDFALLFRADSGRSLTYIRALQALGIPCQCEKDKVGFFLRPEVMAVLNTLRAIDNPSLDIPLSGAMLSELFGFTPDDLAAIRLQKRRGSLYSAVKAAAENGDEKASAFLATLGELRRYAAYESADGLIQRLYDQTLAIPIFHSLPDGDLRCANLRLLLQYAADREQNGFFGLSRFLSYLSRLKENNKDLSPAGHTGNGGNVVHIMTVHGSKGLEYPVVILCDANRKFRLADGHSHFLFHPKLGFASLLRDPVTGVRYKSIPWQILLSEINGQSIAEELRILYVAMTRAKENLLIAVTFHPEKCPAFSTNIFTPTALEPSFLSEAGSFGNWLLAALCRHPDGALLWEIAGLPPDLLTLPDSSHWAFTYLSEKDLPQDPASAVLTKTPAGSSAEAPDETLLSHLSETGNWVYDHKAAETIPEKLTPSSAADDPLWQRLFESENWVYPDKAAETVPVKTGVSALTHQEFRKKTLFTAKPMNGVLSGAERGTALHTFMQFCDFALAKADPAAEIRRLAAERFLTEKQAAVIAPEKVAAFFQSDLFSRMERSPWLRRELRFLETVPASELGYEDAAPDDKITVQGIADCVFEENGHLIVVDYKTDTVDDPEELRLRYAAQLLMYRRLLSVSLGKEVAGAILWSFHFGKELPL